jgi:hypothetical protein
MMWNNCQLVDLYSVCRSGKSALDAKQVQGVTAETNATRVVRADLDEAVFALWLDKLFNANDARERKHMLQ